MRFASGGREAMCCCCGDVSVRCAYACVHACMSERVCTYIRLCVFTYVYFVGGVGLMGRLCVCPICRPTLLTPKGMAGGVGDSFWKKGIGVQWSNGQQCRFYWRAGVKGHRLCAWKPIYQSFWQNSGPPLSSSASYCLISHGSNEKGVHCILHAHTHYIHPGLMSA